MVRNGACASFDSGRGRFRDIRRIRAIFAPRAPSDDSIKDTKLGTASFLHVLDLRWHRQLRQALQILPKNGASASSISANVISFSQECVRNVFPSVLRASIDRFASSGLSEASIRLLATWNNDPGFLDQTAQSVAGESHNVFRHGVSLPGVALRDVVRSAERAVEVNVDLEISHFLFASRPILDLEKRRGGKEDGETEGMRGQGWSVLRIWLDSGWQSIVNFRIRYIR